MISKNKVYIIGYSLDSVMFARELAERGKIVTFMESGVLGYPLDDIHDYISYEDALKIKTLDGDSQFEKLHNATYVHIPYDELRFVNNRNGLISYPINESSFDSADEWEQVQFCLTNIKEFRDKLAASNNYINIYKNFFPKWLYDSLIKYMGINKWGGFRQSKFTRNGLDQEINLSCLDGKSTGTIYRPIGGYKELANRLLTHANIKRESIELKAIKPMLVRRYKDADVIVMDNRVDHVLGYMHGAFDRVLWETETSKESNIEELIDVDDGIVLTPTKEYWCVSNHNGIITKTHTKLVDELGCNSQSQLAPTTSNEKMYKEYKKLVSMYSGKLLHLGPMISTVIK